MRPLHLTVVTAVSTAVLLATTSVFAVTPKVNLGTLKPQEAWKVGTVENNGEQYCAMVGTYSNNVVVAFARNPNGLGSLALDFGDKLFTPGNQYDVTLTAEGLSPRTFSGKASAERSLVVQIGQDGSFYDALSKNGTLGIDMAAATLRVNLVKFSNSHKDLVECAGTLTPSATPALPLVREAKTTVDRELEELGRAKTQLADASTKANTLQKDIAKKTSSFDEIEAQLEAEARAEAKRSRETIASIEAQQTAVRSKLEEKAGKGALDLAVLEPAAGAALPELPQPVSKSAATGGRKLLAAIGTREPVDMPFSTGGASRDIEARELGLADAQRAAAETEQALELKNEIAALEAKKNQQAQEKLAAFDTRQQELSKQTEKLAEKRDTTLSKLSSAAASEETSRGLRANVVAQQAKIAAVGETKQAETAALTRNLASTQADFEARIAALESERQSLRDQVQTISAENTRLKQGQQGAVDSNAEDRLEIARLKQQMLDMETQRQGELSRAAAAQRELEDARQQLAGLRQGGQAEQARLANLQKQLETERTQLAAERATSRGNAVDVAGAESLRQALGKKEGELAQRQSELDKQAEVLAEESQRLHRERQALASVPAAAIEEPVQLSAAAVDAKGRPLSPGQALLTQSQRLVDAERSELEGLRGQIQSLERDLAAAREQASVAAVAIAAAPKAPVVVHEMPAAEKAEMARLKEENTSLRQRLTGFLSGGNKETANTAKPGGNDTLASVSTEVEASQQAPVSLIEETQQPETIAAVSPVVVTETIKTKGEEPKSLAGAEKETAAEVAKPATTAMRQRPSNVSPAMAALGLTADELNATEPAAGHAKTDAGEVLSPIVGNDKGMPAVPAEKVTAEKVDAPVTAKTAKAEKPQKVVNAEKKVVIQSREEALRKEAADVAPVETAAVETKVEAVKASRVVVPVPDATVVPSEGELEIARLAPITAPVPRQAVPVAEPVSSPVMAAVPVAPVTKEEAAQDKGVFGIFGRAMGYGAANERGAATQVVAPLAAVAPTPARPAVIRVTHAQPAPAAQPVAPVTSGNTGITAADANRAAAFLDNIMAFHRPGGTPGPMPAAAPVMAAVPSAPAVQMAATAPSVAELDSIETAAGGPMAAPVKSVPAPAPAAAAPVASAALSRPAYLQQAVAVPVVAPAAVAAPVAPAQQQPAPQALNLDHVLQQAGIGHVQFTGGSDEGGTTLRQWTTGNLNGLYERAASTGNFKRQVEGYVARYRDDCPGKLNVRMGETEKTAAGAVQLVEINCSMAGNTYATTLAFLEAAGGFHTVLHAGQTADAATVRKLGEDLARVLMRVGNIRVAAVKAPAHVVPVAMTAPAAASVAPAVAAPVERPRFRIEIEAPAAPPSGVYDLPTTIIE